MIDLVAKNFKKIVLVYNGANAFELNFVGLSADQVRAMGPASRSGRLRSARKCSPARPIQPADPMPVWKVAMIAADAVLGVLLAVLEVIAIKRFIDRRKKAIAE